MAAKLDLAPHPQQINSDCSDPSKTSVQNTETGDCVHSDILPSTGNESLPSEALNTSSDEAPPCLRRSSRLQ